MNTMHCRAAVRGSDIRVDIQEPLKVKGFPRCAVNIDRWGFEAVLSFPWKGLQHINVLEASAIRATLQYALRDVRNLDTRLVICSDSQVVISVVSRFRTGSLRLRGVVRRIAAICLCSGLWPVFIWVKSAQNPADRPSRVIQMPCRNPKGLRLSRKLAKRMASST